MRIEASVTSVSWIPSESITGPMRVSFEASVTHYDNPPPDVIERLDALHRQGCFRFANHLAAWIDVSDGRIVDSGYAGRGYMCSTRVRLGGRDIMFHPTEFPELRAEPEVMATAARFVQTTGGRTGLPFPRLVRGRPYLQWAAPTVWTTLGLTIHADGSSQYELIGASPFPRHWVYDTPGQLVVKAGHAAFDDWSANIFGHHNPWGGEEAQPMVTTAESPVERLLSNVIMHGGSRPSIRRFAKGEVLLEQGQPGHEIFLLLDGVISVSVDGQKIAELGPGAILGERAVLEGRKRTASLAALTDCTVAVATEDRIDRDALTGVAALHHHEDQTSR